MTKMKHSKIIGLLLIFTLVIMTSAMFLGGCNDKNDNAAPGFYSENTDPADSLGNNGDFYLNNSTSDLFNKVDGSWKKVANVKGQDGVGIRSAKIVDGKIVLTLTNDETLDVEIEKNDYTETDARNAFYAKMKEKAASFGIDVSRLTFNSAISESSGSITAHDMAKMGVMAMGYDEIAKIWNQRNYKFTTSGVEETFEIASTVTAGAYSHYLTDYYYVLGGKTGGLAKTGAGTPVANLVVAVSGPADSTLVGFISLKASDTDAANRFRTAKIAFDIASQKYLDKDADTAALEATIPSDAMITVLSLPKTGNLLSYNYYDWFNENSPYLVYDKNGTVSYYSASSWKILTCMTALDYITDLDEKLTITETCIKTGSGPAFLGGEEITYRDALHLILLPSSNTTCVAIATAVGQKLLDLHSSVSGGPVYSPVDDDFDFETATAVSVAQAKTDITGAPAKVRGVVIGASKTYDNGSATVLLIKDETSNEVCGVAKMLSAKDAYQVNMPFAIGDIIEIPVVSEVIPGGYTYGGEHNKLTFTWAGENFDVEKSDEFVAKYKVGHVDSFSFDKSQVTTVIDSQDALEAFCKKENGLHWELVCIKGTAASPLKAVTGASATAGKNDKDMKREYIRIFYDNPTSLDEQKVVFEEGKKSSPSFSNFSNPYLSDLLSTLLFNQTEYSQEDFTSPYEFVGEIYCFVFGGSTSYIHFYVPDDSCIVKA